jgi:hypothetical protein
MGSPRKKSKQDRINGYIQGPQDHLPGRSSADRKKELEGFIGRVYCIPVKFIFFTFYMGRPLLRVREITTKNLFYNLTWR